MGSGRGMDVLEAAANCTGELRRRRNQEASSAPGAFCFELNCGRGAGILLHSNLSRCAELVPQNLDSATLLLEALPSSMSSHAVLMEGAVNGGTTPPRLLLPLSLHV